MNIVRHIELKEKFDKQVRHLAERLTKILKLCSARDYADLEYDAWGNKLYIKWKEYFRGEPYSYIQIACPVKFLGLRYLSDRELRAGVEEFKSIIVFEENISR